MRTLTTEYCGSNTMKRKEAMIYYSRNIIHIEVDNEYIHR